MKNIILCFFFVSEVLLAMNRQILPEESENRVGEMILRQYDEKITKIKEQASGMSREEFFNACNEVFAKAYNAMQEEKERLTFRERELDVQMAVIEQRRGAEKRRHQRTMQQIKRRREIMSLINVIRQVLHDDYSTLL